MTKSNLTEGNTLPCGKCRLYDVIRGPHERVTGRGWCIAKSVYPHTAAEGRIIPLNAIRGEPGQRAKPYIVRQDGVEALCTACKPA